MISTSRFESPSSSPRNKRRRDSIDKDRLTNRTTSPLSLSNKTNPPSKSAAEKTTAFWDNLSKVSLGPGYLNEIDRRAPCLCHIDFRAQPPWLRSGEITEPLAELQRACRLGRLDLRYLRDIRLAQKYSRNWLTRPMSLKYASMKTASAPFTEMSLMGTTEEMFGQHLEDHEIGPNHGLATRPRNWTEISDMITQARPVPIASQSYDAQYQEFWHLIMEIRNERDVMRKIFPLIQGHFNHYTSGGHEFSNLENLTDGNIVKASPDVYDGAYPSEVGPEILQELGSFIAPLGNRKHPVVPNFFAELKGPKSLNHVGKQQARYAGAIGARAIHQMQSFLAEDPDTVFDNSAYVITAIYYVRSLRLYAHHPIKPSVPGGPISYQMTLISAFVMDASPFDFERAIVAFRNAREWAKKKRDECIAEAHDRKRNLADT